MDIAEQIRVVLLIAGLLTIIAMLWTTWKVKDPRRAWRWYAWLALAFVIIGIGWVILAFMVSGWAWVNVAIYVACAAGTGWLAERIRQRVIREELR